LNVTSPNVSESTDQIMSFVLSNNARSCARDSDSILADRFCSVTSSRKFE